MKNVSIGQYYPSDSRVHRLDGRVKLLLAVAFAVCTFLCKTAASFAFLAFATLALIAVCRIPFGIVMRSVRTVAFIIAFTFFLNMFFTSGAGEPIFSFWIFKLYPEGIIKALLMSVRILSLILGTSLFVSYTTTPIELTDALEDLLKPLKVLHFPVHEFAMMMSIALRFIPTLSDEIDRIMTAQRARGADFSTGSIVKRIKALVPVIIPLFVSSFRRADELATAMECRCYRGGEGRTRLNVPRFGAADLVAAFVAAVFCVSLVLLNRVLVLPAYSI